MTRDSPDHLLVLHAVRLAGFADTEAIRRRFGLTRTSTEKTLSDAAARNWVQHSSFAGLSGWSLTPDGRTENERLLAAELSAAGETSEVRSVHSAFLPLNALLQQACTDWQLRPAEGGRLAPNDHADQAWDDAVLGELGALLRGLTPLTRRLERVLSRFGGYTDRFQAALDRANGGDPEWVDGTEVDSCHRVWFELHEDLIATLGLQRGAES